jgi:hypothetical protein
MLPLIVAGCATQSSTVGTTSAAATVVSAAPPVAPPTHAARPVATLPSPSALELQSGIQVAQIATTASGGLVDARFKVLDASRASATLADPAKMPMLIVGDKPPLMAPQHAMKTARFAQGQILMLLYPNVRGAVQPGTEVTVAMGASRLGPVTAQ